MKQTLMGEEDGDNLAEREWEIYDRWEEQELARKSGNRDKFQFGKERWKDSFRQQL